MVTCMMYELYWVLALNFCENFMVWLVDLIVSWNGLKRREPSRRRQDLSWPTNKIIYVILLVIFIREITWFFSFENLSCEPEQWALTINLEYISSYFYASKLSYCHLFLLSYVPLPYTHSTLFSVLFYYHMYPYSHDLSIPNPTLCPFSYYFPFVYFFCIYLFSSGLWPFATVGWPLQEKDPLSEFNRWPPCVIPTNMYPTTSLNNRLRNM